MNRLIVLTAAAFLAVSAFAQKRRVARAPAIPTMELARQAMAAYDFDRAEEALTKEIAALKMTERMWDDLMDELDPEEYARISKEYEGRKASLCHCSAQWGLCPHYNGSRCTYSDSCKYKC